MNSLRWGQSLLDKEFAKPLGAAEVGFKARRSQKPSLMGMCCTADGHGSWLA
ncbi:hypothetical protein O23A_p0018 [Aeromonas salmonicida]|nr:hypothetical protein O23A_p0018 [Aeromonas salmonicida]